MKEALKKDIVSGLQQISERGLALFTWGNVSHRDGEIWGITPSGIPADRLEPSDVVLLDMEGNVVEGDKKPSSDTPTHHELYKRFETGSIVHTHSTYATMFAQAGRDIDCLGTTHADHFRGSVPVTRYLTEEEMDAYERKTGKVIAECFEERNPVSVSAALVAGHGPFVWGPNVESAVENAAVLEEVARMNHGTYQLDAETDELPDQVRNKHFERKHGEDAYYGQ